MNNLTRQETRIAHAIASEYSEKQIASGLFIAESTVHTHAKNIRKKLGAKNIAGITQKYLLSLDNPKAFIPGIFFLMLQFFMVFSLEDFDVRKVKRGRKAHRTAKVRRGNG